MRTEGKKKASMAELLVKEVEENQVRKVLSILESSGSLEEAKIKVRGLLDED